jgi:ABC-type uncharacterized transport system permease subunit
VGRPILSAWWEVFPVASVFGFNDGFAQSDPMLSGITILCFAASYSVALVLEFSRLLFRSGIRGAMMLGFAGAGLFAHTLYLLNRAVAAAGSPLSSKQDWYLLAAWVLVVVYLYLVYYHPKTAFGVFILPLVLGLLGVGAFVVDSEPFARQPASKVWGIIHASSILLAMVTVLVGFAAGLMYLGQAHRLKRKLSPRPGFYLPSLEWLQRANSRAIIISLILMAIGVFSGVILNLINQGPEAQRLPWTDPFVLSTTGMFVWLLLSASVLSIYRPAREGHRVAYLTLASFVFLVIALAVGLTLDTQHARPRVPENRKDASARGGTCRVGIVFNHRAIGDSDGAITQIGAGTGATPPASRRLILEAPV